MNSTALICGIRMIGLDDPLRFCEVLQATAPNLLILDVLQRLGRLFQAAFQGTEVLGYWGNGEFVVGVPGLTKGEAGDRICVFQTTLRQQVFTTMDGSRFQANFSQGVAEYPIDGLTLQSLYQAAVGAFA